MQIGGFFSREELRLREPYSKSVFNTWMGEPTRLVLLEAILNTVRNENLTERVNETGQFRLLIR
jgi:4-aminobutyrate aminotransferase/(S)-3-amino-2-methylpropionate transaminase